MGQQHFRLNYNRTAHVTHTKDIPGVPRLGDQRDFTAEPTRHTLRKATISRVGDIMDLPNI